MNAPQGISSEEMNYHVQRLQQQSAEELRNGLAVDYGDDGKARVLFGLVTIPNVIAPLVEAAYDIAIGPVTSRLGNFAASIAAKLSDSSLGREKALKVGNGAKLATAIALLAGKPITKITRASHDYYEKRHQMFIDLQPIIESTGANGGNNEVIRGEFDKLHQRWLDTVKSMLPDLPMLAVQSLYVANDHAKKSAAFTQELNAELDNTKITKAGKSASAADIARAAEDAAHSEALAEINRKRAFFDKYKEQATDREHLEELWNSYNSRVDAANQLSSKESMFSKVNMEYLTAGTAAVTQSMQLAIKEDQKNSAAHKAPSAWQMIKNLRTDILHQLGEDKENCGFTMRSADELVIQSLDRESPSGSARLNDYIIRIFQQNEKDHGRGEVKGQALVELRQMSGVIADSIADGSLDAYALVNLVGDNKVLKHNSGKRVVADVKVVQSEIDRLKPLMGVCTPVNPKEFFAGFEQADLMKKTLKEIVSNKPAEGKESRRQKLERDCFLSLFSDDILKEAGMHHKEIVAARKNAHLHMEKIVDHAIGELMQQSGEQLKKYDLKKEDIESFLDIADKVASGDKAMMHNLVEGRGRELTQNILGAIALQEMAQDKTSWAKRINRSMNSEKSAASATHTSSHAERVVSSSGQGAGIGSV